ncbi:MAG: nitroreductase family deazaflavin-dependent oxidoreductase [Nocardiopsaceae bacterium]|nr:nitroreductase family deazaflavin-dependent oxidoreductase [Nocardiopsaceae bacterium]
MAERYRVGVFGRAANAVVKFLLGLGFPIWTFRVLIVPGRKSGKPIHTPLALFTHDGLRYLVAPYGLVNWVRNLRAANGEAVLRIGRRVESIRAVELAPSYAAPVFRDSLRAGPPRIPEPIVRAYRRRLVLPYLDVTPDSPLEEFEREVLTHPVFLIEER